MMSQREADMVELLAIITGWLSVLLAIGIN